METTNEQNTTIMQLRNDPNPRAMPFRIWERVSMAAVAIGLATILGVAAFLEPDPSGMGTHQQLGFPPCSSTIWFGVRCPACGMTTSWALLMDGLILQALHTNVGGVLLAISAIWTCGGFTFFCARGTRSRDSHFQNVLLVLLIVAMVAAASQWLYRLYQS